MRSAFFGPKLGFSVQKRLCLTFVFIVFSFLSLLFLLFFFKKYRMTLPHKIVINVDIGMLLTWNFQKTFKTKFGSLKIAAGRKVAVIF